MIRISGVTKTYDSATVVDDVSVDIPAGGVTSVIGPNGAGKSTLLGIVSRLIRADGGSVSVDGHDVSTTPSKKLARILSVLRQDNRVAVRLTVRELVAFGRFPHSAGRLTRDDEAAIQRAMEYLELEEFAERSLDELSGGQRQRAFVAMVLAQETEYILLDEPLNNLDIKHSLAMMKLLRRTAEDLGRTVVVVIHDINFAAAYSDRIIAMKNGSLVHDCTPAELMTTENLASLYDVDLRVTEVDGRPVAVYF
ncbi:ABC transporter ATP-binding protein [Corynebacterium pygosceleis]|uniref:ATP-binding cassette domain-containing protein n=1 Tax=Corynebacterium pygosceleis TaxID=2800406 RepID=A0A9Q4GJ18_9CORY|nr:ATP-binding cassette domain-containing protein [Corynebacterium pygosceleis]MCK7636906.1 ATP-binding cassette domain-containing protein [Corynebacterium pygosceleis]MCK7674380.1 ATP-binding cassette domain-containing protein [Corynebacterium pygosceleis]MCL0120322.1 ATP-binding cassette domain-containing protein [Corynebacterium pygosceleis]MCX7443869.1 ATP-binding cassette domain-containing protein [Corynebacterium pygosceleis]MCX7467659.1 ATP-binding cassette domain-containing protein [Co